MKVRGRTQRAHRISFAICEGIEIEDVPDLIRHTCDFGLCVNPTHLLEGTHQDNINDRTSRGRYRKGRYTGSSRGSKNPRAILSEADIPIILLRIATGDTNIDIAKDYGVHHATISLIRRDLRWNPDKYVNIQGLFPSR